MMGFGGEKYSKGAYQEAGTRKTQLEDLQKNPVYLLGGLSKQGALEHKKHEESVKRRIEGLHGKGQAEANKLNEEYDRLMASTLEAVKALQEFEKNKLGMSEETIH